MEDKYYPLDTSGVKMPELVMGREACMAQLDVCGAMLSFVNSNIENKESRQLLNEATFKVREAYKMIGNMEGIK